MHYKKTGLKVIIITIVLWILSGYLPIETPLITALGVFGIGSGIFLIFFDQFSHFD